MIRRISPSADLLAVHRLLDRRGEGDPHALVAVPIALAGGEPRPGRPVRLFGGRDSRLRVWHFDPAADGQRFLVLSLNENPEATPVHLVTGWQ